MLYLPADLWSDVCTFLDVRDLAKFERGYRHACTRAAWVRILKTRFQLSMVNRPHLEQSENPRDCVRRFVRSSDARCLWASTEDLLREAAAMAEDLEPTDEVSLAFYAATPVGSAHSDVEHTLYRHWLVIRELAQRGVVRVPAFSKPLRPGDEIKHIVVRIRQGSACGLDHLRDPQASVDVQRVRVEVVCNGVVQFRERVEDHPTNNLFVMLSANFGKFGWASRDDMFVIE